jgi:hypothetical protein
MRILEEQKRKHILDSYPFSNISRPTHEFTVEEQMALSPNAIHIGRSAMDLTHPKVTSKVDESEKGKGYIDGQAKLCNYLLDASLGVDDSVDLMGVRLYDLIARAECDWGICRLCQTRMNHVFRYCILRGKDDPGLRGICEHSDPKVQTKRLHQMIFPDNEDGALQCRSWKDQMINERCAEGNAAFCQGAHTAGDVCSALSQNADKFLQHRKNGIDEWVGFWCHSSKKVCGQGTRMMPTPGVEFHENSYKLVSSEEPDNIDGKMDESLLMT